jgi:hypothetical protein
MSEQFGELIGPRSHPHLNHAFETSDIADIKPLALSPIATISQASRKRPELKDRASIELLQETRSIQTLRLFGARGAYLSFQ